jgi:hypothetical protein
VVYWLSFILRKLSRKIKINELIKVYIKSGRNFGIVYLLSLTSIWSIDEFAKYSLQSRLTMSIPISSMPIRRLLDFVNIFRCEIYHFFLIALFALNRRWCLSIPIQQTEHYMTWQIGNTNFIFSCCQYLGLVSFAHSWEIL